MHGGAFVLFNRFWWLIFPLFWMVSRIIRISLDHNRSQQTLDLIKAYADQGKDPPPQLLEALRQPVQDCRGDRWTLPQRNWVPVGLFFGLAAGFVFGLSGIIGEGPNGVLFVGFILAGMGAGFLGNILSDHPSRNERDDQRTPPP